MWVPENPILSEKHTEDSDDELLPTIALQSALDEDDDVIISVDMEPSQAAAEANEPAPDFQVDFQPSQEYLDDYRDTAYLG